MEEVREKKFGEPGVYSRNGKKIISKRPYNKGSFAGRKGNRNQESNSAKAVAHDVIETTQRGEKVVMAKILRRHGYSETTASSPYVVTNTKTYKREMFNYTEKLEKHRQDVLEAMMKKDLSEEQYRTLADSQTKLTHDVQLLTGGKTENVGFEKDRETLKAIVAAIQIGE